MSTGTKIVAALWVLGIAVVIVIWTLFGIQTLSVIAGTVIFVLLLLLTFLIPDMESMAIVEKESRTSSFNPHSGNIPVNFELSPIQIEAELSRLRRVDPDFDLDGFYLRAKQVLIKIQKAWESGLYEPLKGIISPALCLAWENQVAIGLKLNEGKVYAGEPLECKLVDAKVKDWMDTLIVRYDFGETGMLYLNFERDRMALESSLPEACEQCGAPLKGDRQCQFCKAVTADVGATIDPVAWKLPREWVLVGVSNGDGWKRYDEEVN